jgi:uncharacterized protein
MRLINMTRHSSALLMVLGILSIFGSGCTAASSDLESVSTALSPTETSSDIYLPEPEVRTLTQTPQPLPTHFLPSPEPTPPITATPDPFALWTIDYLMERKYGGGELNIVSTYGENSYFTRYFIEYPSDGLTIAGFMNVPNGDGPFPVVIALHGYIDPDVYFTLDYTTRYADDLARNGFIVIHPNLRNYPPSSEGENLFRVGMAVDVLNLIEIVRQKGNSQGYLNQADTMSIGLWGHSMGGGISTRVMTVSEDVRAVFLYAAMSGDEKQNFEAIQRWSNNERGQEELAIEEIALPRISPQYHFNNISSAVSIHHGLSDELVPVDWSQKTCDLLTQLEKEVECVFYPDMPHTFFGDGDQLLMTAAADFFRKYLSETTLP